MGEYVFHAEFARGPYLRASGASKSRGVRWSRPGDGLPARARAQLPTGIALLLTLLAMPVMYTWLDDAQAFWRRLRRPRAVLREVSFP